MTTPQKPDINKRGVLRDMKRLRRPDAHYIIEMGEAFIAQRATLETERDYDLDHAFDCFVRTAAKAATIRGMRRRARQNVAIVVADVLLTLFVIPHVAHVVFIGLLTLGMFYTCQRTYAQLRELENAPIVDDPARGVTAADVLDLIQALEHHIRTNIA